MAQYEWKYTHKYSFGENDDCIYYHSEIYRQKIVLGGNLKFVKEKIEGVKRTSIFKLSVWGMKNEKTRTMGYSEM